MLGTPLLLSPILLLASHSPPARCAYVVSAFSSGKKDRGIISSDYCYCVAFIFAFCFGSHDGSLLDPGASPPSSHLPSPSCTFPTPWRLRHKLDSHGLHEGEPHIQSNPFTMTMMVFQGVQMMYIGSLMVALAVEESGLHRRIALTALSLAVRKASQLNTNNGENRL